MPFGLNSPVCCNCDSKSSEIWYRNEGGNPVCSSCRLNKIPADVLLESVVKEQKAVDEPAESILETDVIGSEAAEPDEINLEEGQEESKARNDYGPGTRSGLANSASGTRGGKSGAKKSRGRNKKIGAVAKASFSKGRGRRSVFKRQPSKAVNLPSTAVTTSHLFHQDIYYQIGDIVSVIDESGGIYYAQIRGLLQDQYCEKSAVLTWLLPTQSSPPPEHGFDPLTYILGPEEELPRKLEYLDFVMHAPNEYYKLNENIKISWEKETGYIWTSIGAVRRTIHS